MAEPSRAARKRAEQAEEMRRDIIEAAFAEFAERGYHATTIAHVAARLGISSGSFYNYFRNKRDIVGHVVEQLVTRVLEALRAEADAQDAEAFRAQALRIATAVDDVFAEDPRIPRVLLLEATSVDAELTEQLLGVFDLAGATAQASLRNGVARGFLRADLNVAATADAITGMVLGVALRSLRSELSAQQRRAASAAVVALLVDGIVRG